MAKKIIIISSFPVCIVLVVLAIVFVGIGRGQTASEVSIGSTKAQIISLIEAGKQAEAETAYQQLLSNFPHNTHMADVIHHGIASHYRKCKKDDKADEIDKYVLSHWPSTESAMWAQVDIAGASINRKDYAAAQAGVDNLFADFANNEHLCDAIHSVAYRYRQSEKTAKANELDQYVLDHWPLTESAMWSQVDIINSNIDSKDYASAQTGIDSLLTRFSSNENMANVLHGMAYKYRQAQQTARADELDQYVLDNWPSSEIALWAQVDIINSNIDSKDYTTAQTGIDNLLARFSSNENMSNVLQRMAYKYRQAQQTAKADELDQYVLDNWPSSKIALWARMDVALSNVASLINDGNDSEAQAAIDKLITDFAGHPNLAGAIFTLGEEYYSKALNPEGDANLPRTKPEEYYQKALTVWEKIITELPFNKPYTAHAYYFSAACCRRLGKYEKAIEYYQTIVDKWPEREYACDAQFLIARCYYENLERSGGIPTPDATAQIRQACEKLLAEYPNSQEVEAAHNLLEHVNVITLNRKE